MELPKNIVQIGKPDRVHKIYIEDYVVSYIKQLNRTCDDKPAGLALYGKLYEEEGCRYYFLYGAVKTDGLEHRGAYLSQAEKEEIAENGKKYFEEYEFLAWCSIKGEPLERLFVKGKGKGVEVEGYACFYEKNESMLNYMLLSGQKTTETPAGIPRTQGARGEWRAADVVKQQTSFVGTEGSPQKGKVQEIRKREAGSFSAKRGEYMKMAVTAVFIVLCVIGITTLNDSGKLEELQVAAGQVIAGLTEQKLPDADENNTISGGTVFLKPQTGEMEEKAEYETDSATDSVSTGNVADNETVGTTVSAVEEEKADDVSGNGSTEVSATVQEPVVSDWENSLQEEETLPIAYTITRGDTLISICQKYYGTQDKLDEICEMNRIADADNIQVGQIILLP